MSLGSKLTVDGLVGNLYVMQPCFEKYATVRDLVIVLAKQYACCNALAFIIEDAESEVCPRTLALLVLRAPSRHVGVDYQERCQWISIECNLCSLFVVDLGEIRCSLQDATAPLGLCQSPLPWVCGVQDNLVSVANYQFDESDDFDGVVCAARDWLLTLNKATQLQVRVLWFVDYANYSVSFLYFFPDLAARDAFFTFYCCYTRQIVRCNCADSTLDGLAWGYGSTIYKNNLGAVTEIYDSSNAGCVVDTCVYNDPFAVCVACASDNCEPYCDQCDPPINKAAAAPAADGAAQAAQRAASRVVQTASTRPVIVSSAVPVRRAGGCAGCAGRR